MALYGGLGGIHFPTLASEVTDGQLESVFDPSGDKLRNLFRSAINAELKPAWDVAKIGTRFVTKDPVESVYNEAPRAAILNTLKKEDPVLFLYRQSSLHQTKYLRYGEIITTWGLDYMLGPMVVEEYRRLGAIFNATAQVVDLVIRRGGHSSYNSGELVFLSANSPFAYIKVINSQIGFAEFGQQGEGLEVRALHMTLETSEQERDNPDANPDVTEFDEFKYTLELEPDDD